MKRAVFTFCVMIWFIGCDLIQSPDSFVENYPTIFPRMSEGEIQALKNEFDELNNYEICNSINEYGLTGHRLCTDREILRIEIHDDAEDTMIARAAETLRKNKRFTNVYDPGSLEIHQSNRRGAIDWRITYHNQVYNGLEVKNTRIMVFQDAEKVYNISGHWYRDIYIPSSDRFDIQEARETLIGREFTYSSHTGVHTYTVTEDSFDEHYEKVILPHETDNGIELRVSWEISVGATMWYVYVDTTTGEYLWKQQMIVF